VTSYKVWYNCTYDSEEHATPIIRQKATGSPGTPLYLQLMTWHHCKRLSSLQTPRGEPPMPLFFFVNAIWICY